MPSIETAVTACRQLPPSKWNYHETYFAHKIKLEASETLSLRERVTELITLLETPNIAAPRKRRRDSITAQADNNGHVSIIKHKPHGRPEPFATCYPNVTTSNTPRWFQIERGSTKAISISNQLALVQAVMGTTNKKGFDDKTKSRRIKTWKGWFQKDKENGFSSFQEQDLPILAVQKEDTSEIDKSIRMTKIVSPFLRHTH